MTGTEHQPSWFRVRYGTVDEYWFPEYGEAGNLEAAQLVGADGKVYAVVLEPKDRTNHDDMWGVWEDDFQGTLQTWATYLAPTCEPVQSVYLVTDPNRDNTTETPVLSHES